MKKTIVSACAVLVSLFVLSGLATATATPEVTPEPEPMSCYGAQPICIGGRVCCLCQIGGINCNWGCCQ